MEKLVKNLIENYEKLSEDEKVVFKKEIDKKENDYFSNIYKSRKERKNSVIAERKQELDNLQCEIVTRLKYSMPKIESLLKYDTFEGKLLHIRKSMNLLGIGFDVVMDRSKKFEFYCETADGVVLGYNREKGFSFVYANGQPCTSVIWQFRCAYRVSRLLEKDYDEIIQIIDRKVDAVINYNGKFDRDTKSCYKF